MKDCRISESEANKVLVKNLNDRPNALATYGIAKKDGAETKDIFDKQFKLVKEKHNLLYEETKAIEGRMDVHEETVQSQIEGHRTEVGEAVRRAEANSSEAINIANEAINIARSLRAEADAGAFKGDKGDKGDKYTLTEEDKDELVLRVMAALPDGDEVSY